LCANLLSPQVLEGYSQGQGGLSEGYSQVLEGYSQGPGGLSEGYYGVTRRFNSQ